MAQRLEINFWMIGGWEEDGGGIFWNFLEFLVFFLDFFVYMRAGSRTYLLVKWYNRKGGSIEPLRGPEDQLAHLEGWIVS